MFFQRSNLVLLFLTAMQLGMTFMAASVMQASGLINKQTIVESIFNKNSRKPAPAPGVKRPTDLPLPSSATANKKFDRFSGMSLDQLQFMREQLAELRKRASEHSPGAPLEYGLHIFNKQNGFNFLLWYPEAAATLVPGVVLSNPNINFVDFFWSDLTIDKNGKHITNLLQQLQDSFVDLNAEKYLELEDELGYFHWTRNQADGRRISDYGPLTLGTFMYYTEAMVQAALFFYGDEYTAEVHSVFNTAFRFQNWLKGHIFLLYTEGCIKRPRDTIIAARACTAC